MFSTEVDRKQAHGTFYPISTDAGIVVFELQQSDDDADAHRFSRDAAGPRRQTSSGELRALTSDGAVRLLTCKK